jgi:hypothetical protein
VAQRLPSRSSVAAACCAGGASGDLKDRRPRAGIVGCESSSTEDPTCCMPECGQRRGANRSGQCHDVAESGGLCCGCIYAGFANTWTAELVRQLRLLTGVFTIRRISCERPYAGCGSLGLPLVDPWRN